MGRPTIHVEHKKRMPSLRVSGLVLLSAASAGVERAYQRAIERMYRRGETRESLLCELEHVRLPAGLKKLASERVQSRSQVVSSTIEVESFVEALPDETAESNRDGRMSENTVHEQPDGGVPSQDSQKGERQRGRVHAVRVESGSSKLRRAFPWQRGNQS